MRIKTELSERPPVFTVSREGQKAVIVFYTDVQEVQREDGETAYEAVSWTLETSWQEDIAARIGADVASWLTLAQNEATKIAAAEVRELRDKLLAASDSLMALDRLGLEVPSGTSFTSWLSFFRKLGEALLGGIAIYRKALRDLPEQPGFPFDIDWPEKP